MEWFNKFISVLKIPLKILLPALCIFSGALLFLPKGILLKINLYQFSKQNGFIFGLIFSITLCLIIVYIIAFILKRISKFFNNKTRNRNTIKAIERMSEYERGIIFHIYKEKTCSDMLDYADPVVKGLLTRKYLYMGNNAPVRYDYSGAMPVHMTLQPFVREALDWKYTKSYNMAQYLEIRLNSAKSEKRKQKIKKKIRKHTEVVEVLRRE